MNIDQENLIKILGIESLSDDEKIDILQKATDLVQKRTIIRIMETLPEEARERFVKLLEDPDEEQLADFFEAEAPELDQWIGEEIIKVKGELAEVAKSVDNQ